MHSDEVPHLEEVVPLVGEVPLDVVHLNKVPLDVVPLEDVVHPDKVLQDMVPLVGGCGAPKQGASERGASGG